LLITWEAFNDSSAAMKKHTAIEHRQLQLAFLLFYESSQARKMDASSRAQILASLAPVTHEKPKHNQ